MKEEFSSILQAIEDNLVDGKLPENFRLPCDDPSSFVDGAIDGISLFHSPAIQVDDELLSQIRQAIDYVSNYNYEEAGKIFCALEDRYRLIKVLEPILQDIVARQDSLDMGNLFQYAMETILFSDEIALVKAGLILFSIFYPCSDAMKKYIRTLALSNEFTLYAAYCILKWENAEEELFDLIKKVKGWGRIHLVRMLEAESGEIKDWILYNGIDNGILPAYTAFLTYTKTQVKKRLSENDPGHMDYDEFHAILEIMKGLLDEGPVRGISIIPNHLEVFDNILSHATELLLTKEDYQIMGKLLEWAEANLYPYEYKFLCDHTTVIEKIAEYAE